MENGTAGPAVPNGKPVSSKSGLLVHIHKNFASDFFQDFHHLHRQMKLPISLPIGKAFSFAVEFEKAEYTAAVGSDFESQPFCRFGLVCSVTLKIRQAKGPPLIGANLSIKSENDVDYKVRWSIKAYTDENVALGLKERVTICNDDDGHTIKTWHDPQTIYCEDLLMYQKDKYVRNDHIQFIVEVSDIDDDTEIWTDQLPSMFCDQNTSDVLVVTNGVRIPCHKLILSLASPVFAAMFENQMQESLTNEVMISDFSKEVVISFLKCIYDESAIEKEFSSHAQQLLFIANKYDVTFLSKQVREVMICNITTDNAVEMLKYAHQIGDIGIKKKAVEILAGKGSFL